MVSLSADGGRGFGRSALKYGKMKRLPISGGQSRSICGGADQSRRLAAVEDRLHPRSGLAGDRADGLSGSLGRLGDVGIQPYAAIGR